MKIVKFTAMGIMIFLLGVFSTLFVGEFVFKKELQIRVRESIALALVNKSSLEKLGAEKFIEMNVSGLQPSLCLDLALKDSIFSSRDDQLPYSRELEQARQLVKFDKSKCN